MKTKILKTQIYGFPEIHVLETVYTTRDLTSTFKQK